MNKGMVTLSEHEEKRFWVINEVLVGGLTIAEAATALKLSERQVKRLKAAVSKEGLAALAHGNRGRRPVHAIPAEVVEKVRILAQSTYRDSNDTFLSELLAEYEQIMISPSSVRRILRAAGFPSPRKHKPPKTHPRRQRKSQFGMLIQIDGSPHPWFEDRGPSCSLLAAIDDATGQIVAAVFRPTEDFIGYCLLLEQILAHYGIPLTIYSDRHTIFRSPKQDEFTLEQELAGQTEPRSQFGRILDDLGIEHIPARSPQAKGRIERLWETLQGRLPVLFRIAGIATLEQANDYLKAYIPKHNQQFAVTPTESTALFRPLPSHLSLAQLLSWKEPRTLNPGHTISWENQTYRVIPPNRGAYISPKASVTVHRHHDGRISVSHNGQIYATEILVKLPRQSTTIVDPLSEPKSRAHKPAPNHPWRRPIVPHAASVNQS